MFNTKHRVAKLGTLLAVASLGLAGLTGISSAQAADTTTTFKIHLDKILPQSTGINAWIWGVDAGSSDAASTPNFTNEDGYGSYAQFDVTQPVAPTALGFKIRGDESWDHVITPNDQSLPVTGAVNEIWCTVTDGSCTTTAPEHQVEVRVHINKLLADVADYNVWFWGLDHSASPDVNPHFNGSDDLGAYASFKVLQDTTHADPVDPIGLIVRAHPDWSVKATGGDDQHATVVNGVAEVWCEVVDASALGCSSTPPAPVTHVTIHINQPLDATHNYVVWDNHVTNNTDVLFAPVFSSEDRYGAIAKFKFSDPSISNVKFYITDGRTYDSAKITGSADMSVPISAFNGEVWCDVTSGTPSCSTNKPTETIRFIVHTNKPAADVAAWNIWDWGVGPGSIWHAAPTPEENTHFFSAEGDNSSVATWDVTTNTFPAADSYGYLIRTGASWDVAQKLTVGDQHAIIPAANADGINVVEVWCDASALVIPVSGDAQAGSGLTCSQTPATSVKVHFNRPLASLAGWEIAAFGTGASGDTRVSFTGEDSFGATAVIHYNPALADTSAISFVIRKYQPFVAATASEVQKNLDPWSCIEGSADCTGGFFRQTTGDRVVPSGATEVWTLAGSTQTEDAQITAVPSNDVKLTTQLLGGGKVRVFATAGAGTAPTAIVVDVLNRKGVSLKPGVSCTIGRTKVGTTLAPYCNIKGLKKGVKYRFKAHALAYGIGSSAHSARTAPITIK